MDDDANYLNQELSKANLFSLRGDAASALAICHSILEQHPGHLDALLLVADLHLEAREYDQALHWYRTCLEYNGPVRQIEAKLQLIQEAQHGGGRTGHRIEIPSKRRTAFSSLIVLIGVLVVGFLAFLAGTQSDQLSLRKSKIFDRATASSDPFLRDETNSTPLDMGNENSRPLNSDPPPEPIRDATQTSHSAEDLDLFNFLNKDPIVRGHLMSVQKDPRAKQIVITFSVLKGEPGRRTGLAIAKIALSKEPTFEAVMLRGVRDNVLSYIADVPRAKLQETETPEWKANTSGTTNADVNHVLSNEWFLNSSENPAPEDSPDRL